MIRKNITILLVFLSFAPGQIKVIPMGVGAMREALLLEQKGDLETAQKIYESIYTANPQNRQNYDRLKRNYQRQGKHEKAVELIQAWLNLFSNDINEQIELGEAYYRLDNRDKADELWLNIEKNHSKSPHIYQLLFRIYTKLALTKEAHALIGRGRDAMNQPDFMSIDLAHFYDVRRSYDLALEEYILHLKHQPKKEKFIQDRILLMSDEETAQPEIESILTEHLSENEKPIRRILAGYYFKLGKFDLAVNNHESMGFETQEDVERFLSLAKHLRAENQYEKAMIVYGNILSKSKDSKRLVSAKQIGGALLGMGQTYEDQIVIESRQPRFATYFKNNIFFEDHFFGQPDISTESLSSTFELYQDILNQKSGSQISPQVHIRLAEIQYRFTRDFDGARLSLKSALSGKMKPYLELAVYARLSDILLAEGKPEHCFSFIENDIPIHIKTRSDNTFSLKIIQSLFLSGNVEEAQSYLDSILLKMQPTHPHFNDLLEMGDLLSLRQESKDISDSAAFSLYVQAERLLRQSKLSEATEMLASLHTDFPDAPITPNAIYREAIVRFSLNEPERALELTDQLSGTIFESHGLVLKGEIFERIYKDTKAALAHYHNLLESYPSSLLTEPIRRHVRQLNERIES